MPGDRPGASNAPADGRRRSQWHPLRVLAGVLLVAAAAGAAGVYLGVYDVAADVPHTRPVHWLLEVARDRAVAVRARGVSVPADLQDSARVTVGAGLYDDMCSSCHLAPGMQKTEISQGLNPNAPELNRPSDLTPAEQFWIIKHGIKMTGMPAWGRTHSDTLIWDMIAFLQKLPSLSPGQYTALVKSAPADHDGVMKTQTGPREPLR